MAHIIAVSNSKGGVGKTTTCLSLGACLAEAGRRTLVVDLDPEADLTVAAGLDVEALTWSVADVLDVEGEKAGAQRRSVVYATAVDRLYLLPSNPRLAEVERRLVERPNYERRLTRELASFNSMYEFILLDTPPSLGCLTLMALVAAQWVVTPVQCEYYSARRLTRILNVFNAVRERFNAKLTTYLLPTLYDQRTRIGRGVLAQLRQNFPEQLLETVIGVDTRLREYAATSEPITLYAPNSRAAEQYRQLAQEMLDKVSHAVEPASGG